MTRIGIRDPARTLPRALLLGLVIVTLIYTSVTLAFMYLVPVDRIGEGQAIVCTIGDAIIGPRGGALVAAIVIVCVLGWPGPSR